MSWLDDVKAIMDSYGVPEQVWKGAGTAESGLSLHPNPGDEGQSYGLFQIYVLGNQGIPGINQMSREQLEDPIFQAQTMAPRFSKSWQDAQARGLTGPAAFNYAAWAGERPALTLEKYSERTGIGQDAPSGQGTSPGFATPSSNAPSGSTGQDTSSSKKQSWLEEKAGLSSNWTTNLTIGVIGLVALMIGIYFFTKEGA